LTQDFFHKYCTTVFMVYHSPYLCKMFNPRDILFAQGTQPGIGFMPFYTGGMALVMEIRHDLTHQTPHAYPAELVHVHVLL